jgi:hypothetical protein
MARIPKDERDLLASLRTQLRQCVGFEGDKLATDRAAAWRYYFLRPRGDEIAGRSAVVSGDLSAMVEAVLSQMDNAFSTDRLVEFDADGAGDVDQAQLESDCVCQFVGKNNGNLQILFAVKSALLLRNGIVKAWCDERKTTTYESYEQVQPEAIAELAQGKPGIETKILDYDPEAQTLDLAITTVVKKFRVGSVPMYNFIYPDDWNSPDLTDCPFMVERHVEARSKLVERGFSKAKIDKVQRITSDSAVDASAQMPGGVLQTRIGLDSSQDRVEWFEAYALMDDGKGASERRRICFADAVILENVAEDIVPYAAGVVFLNPDRLTGISLYDKLKSVQDINTALERASLDNVNTVNRNRTASFEGVVNADDLADGRTNNNIRVRMGVVPDVRQAITAFTIPDQSSGILQHIQEQKSRRSEMGGAALTLATGEMQLNDRIGSQGVDRAYSVMEELSAHMTRNIAKTLIRSIYLIAHAVMRKHYDYPVTIRQGGRWATTIPKQWPVRENCQVKPGMSPGERARRVQTYREMMNDQVALAGQGMDEVIVSMDTFYTTMMDWARAADVENPERYYVDPRSDASIKAQQGKQVAAKQQSDMQNLLITQAIKLEQMRSAITKYQADIETQFKYYDANLSAQIEEAKIVGNAALEMIKMSNPSVGVKLTEVSGEVIENGKQSNSGNEGAGESTATESADSDGAA